jgi:hypothetical protein
MIEVSLESASPSLPSPPDPLDAKATEDATAKVKKLRSDESLDGESTAVMEKMPADIYELPSDKKYSLAILQGKASGQIFPITKCRITIGRADSDILLDDPECSREHAVLEIRGARITLTDLESTNGTFVDGKRIDQTAMDRNSEFRIGEHVMMLIITDRE